jgi:hypothetical protein
MSKRKPDWISAIFQKTIRRSTKYKLTFSGGEKVSKALFIYGSDLERIVYKELEKINSDMKKGSPK